MCQIIDYPNTYSQLDISGSSLDSPIYCCCLTALIPRVFVLPTGELNLFGIENRDQIGEVCDTISTHSKYPSSLAKYDFMVEASLQVMTGISRELLNVSQM